MDAKGYGSDLEFDGQTITIRHGKVKARMCGTDTIRIPLADVTELDYKPGNALTNGRLHIKVRDTDPEILQGYGGRTLTETMDHVSNGMVTGQSLVVQWRRKDNASFAAIHEAIEGALVS